MKAAAIAIREATLDDAPEIMRHRRLMFRDMGFTDEAALDAMHATSEPYILAGLKDGGYRGWLAVAPDGRVMGGGGVVLHEWLTHPLNLQSPAGLRAQRVRVSRVPPPRCGTKIDDSDRRMVQRPGLSRGLAARQR
jgi:hypothetical protein